MASWYGLTCSEAQMSGWTAWDAVAGNIPEFRVQVDLSDNVLNGTLTTQLGSLMPIEILDMSSNLLYGALPSQLGKLTNLKFLALNGNSFTGTIPSEIGMLNKSITEYINLEDNCFCGEMPSQLQELNILTSGNSLGTPCPVPPPTSMPTITSNPTITYQPTAPTYRPTIHLEDPLVGVEPPTAILGTSGMWLATLVVGAMLIGIPILLARRRKSKNDSPRSPCGTPEPTHPESMKRDVTHVDIAENPLHDTEDNATGHYTFGNEKYLPSETWQMRHGS